MSRSLRAGLGRLRPHVGAAALIVAYIVRFSWVTLMAHAHLETRAFDLGIFDQGVWLLSRFQAPFVTLNGRNLFADHLSLVLLALVPLYWVFPHADALLVVQSLAIGLAGVPIYLLALHLVDSRALATVFLAAFLLHPALQHGNLDEFHPEALLVLFAATGLYAAVVWRPRLLWAAAVAALLVKEDTVLFVLPLALWVAWSRDRKVGFGLAAVSVAYAAVAMLVVMPMLGGGPAIYAERTIPFGGFSGAAAAILHRPATVARYLASEGRAFYLWQMLSPTAFVFLRRPAVAAIAVPVLAFNVASAFSFQHQIAVHYSLVVVPILVAGTVYGVGGLAGRRRRAAATAAVIVASGLTASAWGAFPSGSAGRPDDALDAAEAAALVAHVPADAAISVDFRFAPHLAHRTQVYMWPNPFAAKDWGRFDQEGRRLPAADDVTYVLVSNDLHAPTSRAVFDELRPSLQPVAGTRRHTLYRRVVPR